MLKERVAAAKRIATDLHEAEQAAVADLAGVHLVNLALVHEQDFEYVLRCHTKPAL